MAANVLLRKRIEEIQSQTQSEKEWWERRRAAIQSDFMKELDRAPETGGEKQQQYKMSASGVSDEDAVLVEAGGPTAGGKGGSKKRKGKK